MKIKYLYLNAIATQPNENGHKKIEKAIEKDEPKIDYNSLGIRPPKGDIEYDEDGRVILDDNDIEEVEIPLTIPVENLDSWLANVEGGTRIYTKYGTAYDVVEEMWEIDAVLEVMNLSWFEKIKLSFLAFFCRNKNKQEIIFTPEN